MGSVGSHWAPLLAEVGVWRLGEHLVRFCLVWFGVFVCLFLVCFVCLFVFMWVLGLKLRSSAKADPIALGR